MKLWPFFTFFGGKWRTAPRYPAPKYDTIIEPFAGSAGYAMRYSAHRVLLCEADETIAALWRYLIAVRAEEILRLPLKIQSIDSLHAPPEAKALIGFWLNKGMTAPCRTPSKWMRDGIRPNSQWGEAIRARIARQVEAIRHWRVLADYREAPDIEATWFIDPPYVGRLGQRYRRRIDDYEQLAAWCRARRGQVMVCENDGADWLPFRPFLVAKGTEGRRRTGTSREAIWMNEEAVG